MNHDIFHWFAVQTRGDLRRDARVIQVAYLDSTATGVVDLGLCQKARKPLEKNNLELEIDGHACTTSQGR